MDVNCKVSEMGKLETKILSDCPLAAFAVLSLGAVLGKCSCKKCARCLHYHTVLIGHIDRYFVARYQKMFSKMSWYHFSRTVEHCGIFAWWWIRWQSSVAASALSHLLISQVWMPQWNRYLSSGQHWSYILVVCEWSLVHLSCVVYMLVMLLHVSCIH